MNLDIFQAVHSVDDFNRGMKLGCPKGDYPTFSILETFFDAVAAGIKALDGKIKLEFLEGELSHTMIQMQEGLDVSRPPSFPRSFTRIWCSNVP